MYTSPLERYGFMRPEASGGAGIVNIYVHMTKQLSITLIAPLVCYTKSRYIPSPYRTQILGQLVQIFWSELSKTISTKLRFNIVGGSILIVVRYSEALRFYLDAGQVLMLLLVWSTFCNQFATGVFEKVTHESLIFVVFINLALYGVMSIVCASIARLPWFALDRGTYEARNSPKRFTRFRTWLGDVRFNRKETAAICFCGAAKGNTTLDAQNVP